MLLRKVEKFLRNHDMPATKFGRLAAHDPRFVLDLRMGRIPRARTEARTLEWIAEYEARLPRAAAPAPQDSKLRINASTIGALQTKELSYAV